MHFTLVSNGIGADRIIFLKFLRIICLVIQNFPYLYSESQCHIINNLNNMTRDRRNIIKERLLRRIRMQTTGSPADLAELLGIHERSVKRIVSELRDEGYNIVFWHAGNTYVIRRDYNEIAV